MDQILQPSCLSPLPGIDRPERLHPSRPQLTGRGWPTLKEWKKNTPTLQSEETDITSEGWNNKAKIRNYKKILKANILVYLLKIREGKRTEEEEVEPQNEYESDFENENQDIVSLKIYENIKFQLMGMRVSINRGYKNNQNLNRVCNDMVWIRSAKPTSLPK